MADRWQNDERFVAWLLTSEYIEMRKGKIHECMSLGTVLYMWEAWRARADEWVHTRESIRKHTNSLIENLDTVMASLPEPQDVVSK